MATEIGTASLTLEISRRSPTKTTPRWRGSGAYRVVIELSEERAPGRDRFARRTRAPSRMLHASPGPGASYRKGRTMHALLISFTSAAPLDQLAEPFAEYAHALRDVPGLISKTWIFDGTTVGGFYTFTTAADIDAYLAGALWTSVATNPAFSGFRFERFGIVDELTALTSPDKLATRA